MKLRKLRPALLLCLLATLTPWGSPLLAQTTAQTTHWQQRPVPYYSTAHLLHGLYRDKVKHTRELHQNTQALHPALHALCTAQPNEADNALKKARAAWTDVMVTWDYLATVPIGPLLDRRSLRQIDTAPARPALIARAIATQPQGAKAFERVGTPAKGLPALEWLLWSEPIQPNTPACNYAMEVALDVEREAKGIYDAFRQIAFATDWDAEEQQERSSAAMTEFINQWIGGIERLRWPNMEKPLRAAESSGGIVPAWPQAAKHWPRAASGQTTLSWDTQRTALEHLTVADSLSSPPTPGYATVPLETYLRGRGLNPLADKLVQAMKVVNDTYGDLTQAHAKASKNTGTHIMQFTRALAALKRLGEAEIAPALQVTIGFSDADGD